jgi:FG-GAP-like repeat
MSISKRSHASRQVGPRFRLGTNQHLQWGLGRANPALLALLAVALVAPVVSAAGPGNDDVADAVAIEQLPFTTSLDTSEATPAEGDPDCSSDTGNPTVWYSFTPAESATYGVSTFGSGYDTTLTVGTMGADGFELILCNDDAGSQQSALVLPMEGGVEYLVMVGACCAEPGGPLALQVVKDPEVGSAAFLVPPDLTDFLAQRPRGDAGPLWRDATAETTGPSGAWTNKVEVADIDGDGLPDILHANGGDYDTPGDPVAPAAFLNAGPGVPFIDASADIFGDGRYHARVIKARDVTGDGIVDLLIGNTYQTQSRLLQGLGGGTFEDVTDALLPQVPLSVGDLEVGDVDGDLDLDIVLADWGPGSPLQNAGGPVRLWRNTDTGWVADETAMPSVPIGFSWDLELVDVDGDWDLDVAVSCKICQTSRLYLNDGTGTFSDVTDTHLPPASNNYDFEPMDLDGDGDPELVTINDGPLGAERVLRNDGGVFTDVTDDWWPSDQNPGFDDNVVVYLDAESDGDADFIVGSLDGPDRLIINDGTGRLIADPGAFEGPGSPGTLGMAVADLDGDGRLDVVDGQGEVTDEDLVYLATEAMPPDTAAPVIDGVAVVPMGESQVAVLARIHDHKTPVLVDDFTSLTASIGGQELPLDWYGDALWRVVIETDGDLPSLDEVTICATDRAGNEVCESP